MTSRYNNKENRMNTEAANPNRSVKKKNPHEKSITGFKKAKRKQQIFNLERFINNLKTENIKTERFNSPNKRTIYEVMPKRDNSSKSRQLNRSIQTSREKSGDTYKKTNRLKQSKSKSKTTKLHQCLSILTSHNNVSTFTELALDLNQKFEQVDSCLKSKQKEENKENLIYTLNRKYKEMFNQLIQSMVSEIRGVYDEKESEILHSVENITTLQNDIIEKQSIVQKLELDKQTLQDELNYANRMIQRQNKFILEIKNKQNRTSKLLYALRRHGIDIDKIYQDEVQTPYEDSQQQQQQQQQQDGIRDVHEVNRSY